jgi:hypothetical protein
MRQILSTKASRQQPNRESNQEARKLVSNSITAPPQAMWNPRFRRHRRRSVHKHVNNCGYKNQTLRIVEIHGLRGISVHCVKLDVLTVTVYEEFYLLGYNAV